MSDDIADRIPPGVDGPIPVDVEALRAANFSSEQLRVVIDAIELAGSSDHATRIAALLVERDAWREVALTQHGGCETCRGEGFVTDAVDRTPSPCGECRGTGKGAVAMLVADARASRAADIEMLVETLRCADNTIGTRATHHPDCPSAKDEDADCDCGLDATRCCIWDTLAELGIDTGETA